MLIETIHFPSAYEQIDKQVLDAMLQILRDLVKKGILLQEDKSVRKLVGNWPVDYRKRGEELLKKLQKNKRFIHKISMPAGGLRLCSNNICNNLHSVLINNSDVYAVMHFGCAFCLTVRDQDVIDNGNHYTRIINPDRYQLSDFPDRIQNTMTITLSNREWFKQDFEKKVLIPILKHTSILKIYDRQIGRSLEKTKDGKLKMKSGFERDIKWIIDLFLKHSSPQLIEIYCGLKSWTKRDTKKDILDKKRYLISWGLENSMDLNIPISVVVKLEEHDRQAPHARYIITDQICMLIERGFELTNDDESIRDVVLTLLEKPSGVEKDFNELKDIEEK